MLSAVLFENADDAVKAAVDAQLNLSKEKWEDDEIKMRIGIHSAAKNSKRNLILSTDINRNLNLGCLLWRELLLSHCSVSK